MVANNKAFFHADHKFMVSTENFQCEPMATLGAKRREEELKFMFGQLIGPDPEREEHLVSLGLKIGPTGEESCIKKMMHYCPRNNNS